MDFLFSKLIGSALASLSTKLARHLDYNLVITGISLRILSASNVTQKKKRKREREREKRGNAFNTCLSFIIC